MMFFLLFFLVFLGGVGYFLDTGIRRRKLLTRNWGAVLGALEPVDLEGIRSIAETFDKSLHRQPQIDAAAMWKVVGGLDGLRRLRRNAWAMLDLAVYAEKWNLDKGLLVSEMMRQDADRLNRAIFRIQLGFFFHFGFMRSPFHLQEAVATYYTIRGRLVDLYHVSQVGLIPGLEATGTL